MVVEPIDRDFSICMVSDVRRIDFSDPFCFVGKTDGEISLVCSTPRVPQEALKRDDGWRAFRIRGTLDFSLVGVLARISSLLAGGGIGIFAVSTYRTDYIFTKRERFAQAVEILRKNGYEVGAPVSC